MKKKKGGILFFSIFIIFGFKTYGQDTTSMQQYIIKFQWVVFKTSDSSYKFTRFIDQKGSYYFNYGFGDTTYPRKFFAAQNNKDNFNYYCDYKYINNVDTIPSYFLIKSVKEIDTIINNVRYLHINISDEIQYSYILRQLGEPIIINSNQRMFRILYPCDNINRCKFYNLIKIKYDDESAKLYSIAASSDDFNGIQMIYNDSCAISIKDISKIRKQLNQVNNKSDLECRLPGNPWLLEYNENIGYKHFFISDSCRRGKKNFNSILSFFYSILVVDRKYFKICAPIVTE
jgi:hypothetical protein